MNPKCLIALTVLLAAPLGVAQAIPSYAFHRSGDDVVLAVLEFNDLPADDASDVATFTFTQAGDDLFALGISPYLDLIESITTSSSIVDDGSGGLGGSSGTARAEKLNGVPIPSSFLNYPGFTNANTMQFAFSTADLDVIDYRYDAVNAGRGSVHVSGNWLAVQPSVPEPATAILTLMALGIMSKRRRRTVKN